MEKVEQNNENKMKHIREEIKQFARDNYEYSQLIVDLFFQQYKDIFVSTKYLI